MIRIVFLLYGLVAYLLFFAAILYGIGFVGNLVVPKGIDDGVVAPLSTAILVDVLLLAAVRGAAQRDGPAAVQGMVDALRAAADRAEHVRRGGQLDSTVAVLAVAADAGRSYGRWITRSAAASCGCCTFSVGRLCSTAAS